MVCPHCSTNLLYRERGDRRCSRCRREFALEPKQSPLRLHDIRARALAERLGDGRGLRYTFTQFHYAAARNRLPGLHRRVGVAIAFWCGFVVLATYITCIATLFESFFKTVAAGFGIMLTGVLLIYAFRPVIVRRTRIRLPATSEEIAEDVFGRWQDVYRELPPGAVDENRVPIPAVAAPRYALVCPNRSVLACLAANKVPQTYDMALLDDPRQVPPGVPVLVLHNASLPGQALARDARQWFGARVRLIGVAPRMVMDNDSAMRLRERPPRRAHRRFLAGEPLSPREIEWLAFGWWAPVAAVPPARLLAAVSRTVEQLEAALEPDRGRARRVGFLTWPAA